MLPTHPAVGLCHREVALRQVLAHSPGVLAPKHAEPRALRCPSYGCQAVPAQVDRAILGAEG
eukprot:4344246-Alexandrium_andersonii.AAC.1